MVNKTNLKNIWLEKYDAALKNTKGKINNDGILIEIAAQHPLVDGITPNTEFTKRLLLGIDIYFKYKELNQTVKIYVPGSIHNDDKISLSEAGKNFLLKHGVKDEDIFSVEMNLKYKRNEGVYNSSDECYVASKLFNDLNYKELHSVCSSAQLMRKALSYIEFGVYPFMHSVTCYDMFHNYVNEFFDYIPILLEDKNGLQGDSKEGKRLREERKPNTTQSFKNWHKLTIKKV